VLDGEAVALSGVSGTTYGRVSGIGADGALIVENESGETRRVISGDVTVRLADARD
jgi:biotin-(acetyl-CoA carboxylase) ligase